MRIQSTITDAVLIKQYQNGSEAALEALLARHKDRVFGYLVNLVRNRQLAEDLFQDTFFKVISTLKKDGYNDEGKFLPWVLRIAHNLTVDYFRLNKRIPEVKTKEDFDVFNFIPSEEPNVHEKMLTEQVHSDVAKLVEFLPAEQKEVLKMRIFCDMSFKEIAEETDTSINTCLGRMRYALINLRKMIDEKEVALRF
jgi:RNA polymerase sigma factor (sigma-70 family)